MVGFSSLFRLFYISFVSSFFSLCFLNICHLFIYLFLSFFCIVLCWNVQLELCFCLSSFSWLLQYHQSISFSEFIWLSILIICMLFANIESISTTTNDANVNSVTTPSAHHLWIVAHPAMVKVITGKCPLDQKTRILLVLHYLENIDMHRENYL